MPRVYFDEREKSPIGSSSRESGFRHQSAWRWSVGCTNREGPETTDCGRLYRAFADFFQKLLVIFQYPKDFRDCPPRLASPFWTPMPSNDEVEASKLTITCSVYGEEQRFVEDSISGVSRLVWKEELSGQEMSSGALNFEVEMTCAAGIKRWHDRVEPPASLRVGKLMSAQAKAFTVVFTVFVSVPDFHKAARQRLTAIVEDKSCNGYPFATRRTGIKIAIERCVRLEERTGFPFKGEAVLFVAHTGQGQNRYVLCKRPQMTCVSKRQRKKGCKKRASGRGQDILPVWKRGCGGDCRCSIAAAWKRLPAPL